MRRLPVPLLVVAVWLTGCAPEIEEPVGPADDVVDVEQPEPTVEATPTPDEPAEPDQPPPPAPADAWVQLEDAPVALTEVAAATFGGHVWVVGGFDAGGEAVPAVQVYDPDFDAWSDGPPLPEGVHHTALVSTGDSLFVVGGYRGAGFGAPTAAVYRLDPTTGMWEQGPALPEARAAGAAAWDGSRLVYSGGVGPGGLAGDVFVLEGDSWRRLGELSQAREHLAAASDGAGRVWFLAGRTGGLETNLAAVDLVEGEGVGAIGELPTARGGVGGFWHPAVGACAAGGEDPERTYAEVECIDADGAVTVLPELGMARHGLGVAATEGMAFAVLGGPEPRLTVSAAVEMLPLD